MDFSGIKIYFSVCARRLTCGLANTLFLGLLGLLAAAWLASLILVVVL